MTEKVLEFTFAVSVATLDQERKKMIQKSLEDISAH